MARLAWIGIVAGLIVMPGVLPAQQGQTLGPVGAVGVQRLPLSRAQPPRMPPRDRSGRPREAVTGTASISGRVLAADTGQPLRRATVQAFATGGTGVRPFVARTDDTGAYTIREMPAGVYTLRAQRGGYVDQTLGQTHPTSVPRRVTIEERARLTGVDFSLQPGGVIAGRVTDDMGEPAEGVFVRVLRAQPWRGRVRYLPVGGRVIPTDDLGHFRVYGLPPGEYILAADPSAGRMMAPVATSDAPAVDMVATYAPGTPAPGEAQRLTVVAGQVTPMDVQLVAARVVTVEGRVVDSTGTPLESGMVNLRPADVEVMAGGFSGASVVQGSFTLRGVTPGAYTLHVTATPRRAAGRDALARMETAEVPLNVGSADVEPLVITTSPGSTVTGRVIVEGNRAALQASSLRVFARPIDPEPTPFPMQGQGAVQNDYTVTVPGVRGLQALVVAGLPRGWWVKAVRINGQNALDGFDFGNGRTWAGLEIVVNDRPSSIGGQVTGIDGRPSADYVVLAFPQDFESRVNLRLPGVSGLGAPDQNGGFVVESLRPGEYYVVAAEPGAVDVTVLDDPDRLRELSQRAQPITLGEGDLQFLSLKLGGTNE